MKKKGDGGLSIGVIIGVVFLVFVIVVMSTGVWQKYSFFISVAKLIPGFNYTESTEGMSIVGINLDNKNRLEYFTGEKWKKIDGDKFVLGDYEIKHETMKDELVDFYFSTPRKPGRLSLDVNHWRYWEVKPITYKKKKETKINYYKINIVPSIKKSFGEKTTGEGAQIDINNQFLGFPDANKMSFAQFDLETKPELKPQIIEWRDSILQENKCEKFLQLNLKKNKQDWSKSYTVRRNNQYVFVDLNEPVSEGKKQNWDDDKCLGVENYEDKDKKKIKDVLIANFKYHFYYDSLPLIPGIGNEVIEEKATFIEGSNISSWSYSKKESDSQYTNRDDEGYVSYSSYYADKLNYAPSGRDGSFYEFILNIDNRLSKHNAHFNCDGMVGEDFKIIIGTINYKTNIFKNDVCIKWSELGNESKSKLLYSLFNEFFEQYKFEENKGVNSNVP